jgi:catechol 2,3-dioxygenase-like lactoylglutathione lyase family enzyme
VVNAVVMAPGKHIGARRGQPEDARRVGRMAIGGNRIYHVNSNCTDLERAARFYEALGLRRVIRTVPSRPQPGDAFGLAEVAWDAWVLQSEDGLEGLSLDLLEWTVPPPTGAPPSTAGQPGLNRLCMSTPDLDATVAAATAAGGTLAGGPVFGHGDSGPRTAMLRDPDGVPVQLFEGEATSIAQVIVNCVDLDRSLAYYRDVMGLTTVGDVREIVQPAALHGLEADGTVRTARLADSGSRFSVTLVQWLDPAVDPASVRVRAANELGLFRMAWSTDDCARDEAVVRAAGSVPLAPTGTLSVGDALPLLLVLFWPGPDGECLELIQTTDESGVLSA